MERHDLYRVEVYAVISDLVQDAIEVFRTRGEADSFVEEVRQDDAELAAMLEVVAIKVSEENQN
jgi:hypothetical protein